MPFSNSLLVLIFSKKWSSKVRFSKSSTILEPQLIDLNNREVLNGVGHIVSMVDLQDDGVITSFVMAFTESFKVYWMLSESNCHRGFMSNLRLGIQLKLAALSFSQTSAAMLSRSQGRHEIIPMTIEKQLDWDYDTIRVDSSTLFYLYANDHNLARHDGALLENPDFKTAWL